MTSVAPTPSSAFDLYLEVSLNGQPTHSIVSFTSRSGRLFIQPKDLKELGVDLRRLEPPLDDLGAAGIDLRSVPGLKYQLDEAHQSIDLILADELRTPYAIGRNPRPPPLAGTGTGLVFNYDALVQSGASVAAGASFAASSEQRLFGAFGVLTNTGIATLQQDEQHYVRQSTTYQHDDPATLTAFQAGDILSSSLSWTRTVRLGGVAFGRDFALKPDLITFPIPQLGGSAALPSTVDLYVNNVHQLSSEVPGGPFVINGAVAITGAGLATIVVRDPLGRAVTATLPIYVDSRLLAAGLSSYSIETGALRYNYGLRSFDYEGHSVVNGTYRHGIDNDLTFESHAEATQGLIDAGFGALLRMGTAGVLNASIAGSSNSVRREFAGEQQQVVWPSVAGVLSNTATSQAPAPMAQPLFGATGAGGQATLGYQLIVPAFSITAQMTRSFDNFADLAAVGGTPASRALDQVTASIPLGLQQTLGSSFVHVKDSIAGRSAIGALWDSARLTRTLSAFVNLSRDFEQRRSASVSIGLSVDFGDRVSGFTNAGTSAGHAVYGASLSRSADYGGGWEWSAQSNRSDDTMSSLARGGYLGRYGEITAAAQVIEGHTDVSAEAVGGLLFMDGVIEAARHIGSGFSLVSTDGTANVTVLHENRPLGVTDAGGHLLVPDLNPYEHNTLAIDTLNLPADDKIPVDRLDVTPRAQSGVLAHFPIQHYNAGTVTLVDGSGKFLPAGTVVHDIETRRDSTVGYDGLAFIEDLAPQNHLRADGAKLDCEALLNYQPSAATSATLPYLGQVSCRARAGHSL